MRRIALLALLLSALCHAEGEADLLAYTEEWAPYNFTQDGKVTGIATDLLHAACQHAQLRCDIQMVPWARGYALASSQPNTLIYTTARKPARETLFTWVGPILPRTTWIFARSNLPRLPENLAGLRRHRIGVVRGEASIDELQAAGVPDFRLVRENSNAALMKLLQNDLVDAVVDTEAGMAWQMRLAGIDPTSVRKLFPLTDTGHYYFALNPQTDPAIAQRLQAGIDSVQAGGEMQRILQRY